MDLDDEFISDFLEDFYDRHVPNKYNPENVNSVGYSVEYNVYNEIYVDAKIRLKKLGFCLSFKFNNVCQREFGTYCFSDSENCGTMYHKNTLKLVELKTGILSYKYQGLSSKDIFEYIFKHKKRLLLKFLDESYYDEFRDLIEVYCEDCDGIYAEAMGEIEEFDRYSHIAWANPTLFSKN